jgi:hypothetical protein
LAGPQQTPLLGVEDHPFRQAVLDAPARIQEFALGVQRQALRLEVQRDHRRVADQLENCVAFQIHLRHSRKPVAGNVRFTKSPLLSLPHALGP